MLKNITDVAIDVLKKAGKYEIIMSVTIEEDIYDIKVDLSSIEGLSRAISFMLLELESTINEDEETDGFKEEHKRDIMSKIIDKLPIMKSAPEWN